MTSVETKPVLLEIDGAIATVTLNRPEKLNTFSEPLMDNLRAALEEVANRDDVRVLILTGAGRAFSAGGDLGGISGNEGPPKSQTPVPTAINNLRARVRVVQMLHDMPKVTIAAINGACAGAGLSLAAACDIRYASSKAAFNTAFLTAGLSGDFGISWTFQRLVGPSVARELMFAAEKFTAARALEIGLVSDVREPDELMPFVASRAALMATRSPLALAAMKGCLNGAQDQTFATALDNEIAAHVKVGRTADCREAASAFLEKRAPVFQGR